MSPLDAELMEIGEMVYDRAEELFANAGESNDFCVQYMGGEVIFGGLQRLRWNPINGFRIDKQHSSENFIKTLGCSGVF